MTCVPDENATDGTDASSSVAKNTNWEMYGKNPLYRTCIYCNEKFNGGLVCHYAKDHSDREVPISRMSPEMAAKLMRQSETFKIDSSKKITGLCYFCETPKSAVKGDWRKHLLIHTGEHMFNCTECHAQMKWRQEHDAERCSAKVVNVFETRDDGSLIGYMCNDCNYVQFSRRRLIEHLENEHGFQSPSEPNHFRAYKLVEGSF